MISSRALVLSQNSHISAVLTIESHSLGCLIDRSEFQESKVLVEIDLTCQNRIADCLSKPREVHLLVEELHHLFFRYAEWNISDIQPRIMQC